MIRAAKKSDMQEILRVYSIARGFMAQSGNASQWGNTYPPVETLNDDIEKNQLFVILEDGRICGAFVFFVGEEPTYKNVYGGAFKTQIPCGIIHRVASDNTCRGTFGRLLDFCKSRAEQFRIDTHKDNKVMQHVLEKHGFSACGTVYIENGEERIAYELIK